jgi:membrane fusion protein, multidrug efflux system
MSEEIAGASSRKLGIPLSAGIIVYALLSGAGVLWKTVTNPRTDDAEVFANFIGIAPVVNGPITNLHIVDNQFIKEGELLFEIDDRPYRYALAQAESMTANIPGSSDNTCASGKNAGLSTSIGVLPADPQRESHEPAA